MQLPTMLQGRPFGPEQLRQVEALIRQNGGWSRYRLSRELAALWNWRTPRGQLKDMAARTLLLKMQTQLARINRDLDELSVKVEKSSAAAQAEWKPRLQELRHQAEKLKQQLDAAKNATESTWDEVKSGSKKAYNELKDGFQRARQWVSDKVAP